MKFTGKDPRVPWAMERTYLAWVRTSLALMGFGFVVARSGLLFRLLEGKDGGTSSAGWSLFFGVVLVGLGVLVQTGALVEYLWFASRARQSGFREMKPSYLGLTTGLALVLLGSIMFAHLLGWI